METLMDDDLLREKGVHEKSQTFSHLQESVQEIERPRFLASSSDRDLASTGTLSETVDLEVVGSTLHVDTVRGEPNTWFASI